MGDPSRGSLPGAHTAHRAEGTADGDADPADRPWVGVAQRPQTSTATASGGGTGGGGTPASCDVLVTAPVGTALSAVASGLAATVGGPDTGGTVVLYAGTERLDPSRCALGEPPLVDGAVLSLNVPGPDVRTDGTAAATALGDGPQLHVVAGPTPAGCTCCTRGRSGSGAPPTRTSRWTIPTYRACTAP